MVILVVEGYSKDVSYRYYKEIIDVRLSELVATTRGVCSRAASFQGSLIHYVITSLTPPLSMPLPSVPLYRFAEQLINYIHQLLNTELVIPTSSHQYIYLLLLYSLPSLLALLIQYSHPSYNHYIMSPFLSLTTFRICFLDISPYCKFIYIRLFIYSYSYIYSYCILT